MTDNYEQEAAQKSGVPSIPDHFAERLRGNIKIRSDDLFGYA